MVHLPVRFSSLPPEVKANVFQHVAWQEARWRNRIEFLEDTLQASEREKHVDGLSAASLVSKEWRSFASRHMFETILPTKTNLPLFKHRILRRHSRRFRVARLDNNTDDITSLDYTLSIIPTLPQIRSLIISVTVARRLFGNELFLDAEADEDEREYQSIRIETLGEIARQVDSLQLGAFTPAKVSQTLSMWSNAPGLRRLHLSAFTRSATDHDMSVIASSLQGHRHLEQLVVDYSPASNADLPPPTISREVLEALRNDPPPLASINFQTDIFHRSELDLISAFSHTLRHLEIVLSDLEEHFDCRSALDFPHLTSLYISIKEDLGALASLLPLFFSSPLIHLRISEDTGIVISEVAGSPLLLVAKNFPSLRKFEVDAGQFPITADEFTSISTFCSNRALPPPTVTPFDAPEFLTGIDNFENDVICDGLDQVLEFGKLEVGRLRAGREVADSVALLESLRPLDLHRRRWLD